LAQAAAASLSWRVENEERAGIVVGRRAWRMVAHAGTSAACAHGRCTRARTNRGGV